MRTERDEKRKRQFLCFGEDKLSSLGFSNRVIKSRKRRSNLERKSHLKGMEKVLACVKRKYVVPLWSGRKRENEKRRKNREEMIKKVKKLKTRKEKREKKRQGRLRNLIEKPKEETSEEKKLNKKNQTQKKQKKKENKSYFIKF